MKTNKEINTALSETKLWFTHDFTKFTIGIRWFIDKLSTNHRMEMGVYFKMDEKGYILTKADGKMHIHDMEGRYVQEFKPTLPPLKDRK